MIFTCPCFSPEVIAKLTSRMWGYCVTLSDIVGMHIIEYPPVCIYKSIGFTVSLISSCAFVQNLA